jgi:Flp pilus assembly protein CpaB
MSRRVLLIGLALLLAATGTAGVLLYVKQADARAVAGKETVSVLVAAKKVPVGTSVSDARANGMMRTEIMPRGTVPDDTLFSGDDIAALSEQVATGDIEAGQLLRRPMFAAKSAQTDGLSVPDGKMVVTVEVDAAAEVAGYLKPGSMVSVFNTFTVLEGKGRTAAGDDLARNHDYDQATRLLLPKIEVLAVGPAPAQAKDAATAAAATATDVLVTVAVSQAEAEKLIHGTQVGHIYLALVPDGTTPTPGQGVDNRTVFGTE